MRNKQRPDYKAFVKSNIAAIVFIIVAIAAYFASGMQFTYVLEQVLLRLAQNSFLVLALIIPVIAGMGLNFSITVGAMAAQIAIFLVTNWAHQYGAFFTGVTGLVLSAILMIPLALLFGYLAGKLLNKTKGQEMIAGMILGFFATGIYMFIFLIVIGGFIPIENPFLIITGGVGVKNTYDIAFPFALDNIFKRSIGIAVPYVASLVLLYKCGKMGGKLLEGKKYATLYTLLPLLVGGVLLTVAAAGAGAAGAFTVLKLAGYGIVLCTIAAAVYRLVKHGRAGVKTGDFILVACMLLLVVLFEALAAVTPANADTAQFIRSLLKVEAPLSTYAVIGLLCVFNHFFLKTKIGQDISTVGQSMSVATASGIDVDKKRIYAIVLSTLFAGFGQLLYLQSLGSVQTYAAHNNVALYSIAALLVGGASITRATNRQALFGIIIFHTILIVLPGAVGNLFQDAQHSEYFRTFMLYSVICFSLITYAVSSTARKKRKARDDATEESAKEG